MSTNEQTITYTVTEGTTQRGQRKLVSSDGFTYVFKVYFEFKKYSDDIHKWNIDVLSFYVVHAQSFILLVSSGFIYVFKVYFILE